MKAPRSTSFAEPGDSRVRGTCYRDAYRRTDTWDMGADESVAGTILLDPKVLTWREIEPQ